MIFVTVGTHEQQFNRLIKEIDELKKRASLRRMYLSKLVFQTTNLDFADGNVFFHMMR